MPARASWSKQDSQVILVDKVDQIIKRSHMNTRQWVISIASLGTAAVFLLIALVLFVTSPSIEMLLVAGVLVLCAVLMVAQAGKPVRAELAKQAQRRNNR